MTELLARPSSWAALEEAAPRWEPTDDAPLVDVLDRLLERGAAVGGDVVLSLAGIDLVWLGLRVVLGGPEHAPPGAVLDPGVRRPFAAPAGKRLPDTETSSGSGGAPRTRLPRREARPASGREKRNESESAEDGLVRLVLSLVELLRQVMERQALRRTEQGALTDEQAERLGVSLLGLSERMEELKAYFGLGGDDLSIRLGRIEDVA